MDNCNPISTAIDSNQRLSKTMGPTTEKERQDMMAIPYQQAVGSLLFASQVSRPDINFAVNNVSRFCSNPGHAHWSAVKRILRYLKGTMSLKLVYSKCSDSNVTGYCDADWGSEIDDRKSTTGYVFMHQGGAVTWNSKKQPTVALSTMEAEYMALCSATQEAIWLKQLDNELFSDAEKGTIIYSDNQSAIYLASTHSYHARAKHIDIKHHFVREKVEDGSVILKHVPSSQMIADSLTKPVVGPIHLKCTENMGLVYLKNIQS